MTDTPVPAPPVDPKRKKAPCPTCDAPEAPGPPKERHDSGTADDAMHYG